VKTGLLVPELGGGGNKILRGTYAPTEEICKILSTLPANLESDRDRMLVATPAIAWHLPA
jgi:hypothetical protein